MGYLGYYLAIFAMSYALQYPWLLLLGVVFFGFRRFIPDPWVWLRTFHRISALRRQVQANPSNVTARRDLARTWLELRRPRAALTLLEEARGRFPDDAELLLLSGEAMVACGRYEEALVPLVKSVGADSRVGFGRPYALAGDALAKIGRHEEAEDAYERHAATNTSSIEPLLKLANIRRRRGDGAGTDKALVELTATWAQLPGYLRRRQLKWWFQSLAFRCGLPLR